MSRILPSAKPKVADCRCATCKDTGLIRSGTRRRPTRKPCPERCDVSEPFWERVGKGSALRRLTPKEMMRLRPDIAPIALEAAFTPHTPKNCPFLHITSCPGCGRSCQCHPVSRLNVFEPKPADRIFLFTFTTTDQDVEARSLEALLEEAVSELSDYSDVRLRSVTEAERNKLFPKQKKFHDDRDRDEDIDV